MHANRLVCLVVVLGLLSAAWAGPALPVTKPPLAPVPSWSGPPIDPNAIAGQWFVDLAGNETYRTHEFHDNLTGLGGGFAGAAAIRGTVVGLVPDAAGGIGGFFVAATITNDGGPIGTWEEGVNSHGEHVLPGIVRQPYQGTLYDVKLTTSFADDGVVGNFPGPGGAYFGDELSQNIYAIDYEQLAWYCWTPDNPHPELRPWGSYMVPTWDFGDIPLGGSVTRTLAFGLYTPISPTDPLGSLLMSSYENQFDVFLNRTMSLKISQYFDALSIDTGAPYPLPPMGSSDVSVFFNVPEPGTLALLAVGGLLLRRRR
ncbi:MAG TPA: PEP-CTERM sorting domain-containing protein [Phycisphaerae bacterium]|nr:PEP-CTERM sorting domain-containing protein [Phycisphaerae bacterium]HNU46018.1 PEP-CTERM sorting domain-containing protein [Phycisphaerae bacterium]